MAAPCPTCGKEVDPLRAPAARVAGGKIVAYCSAACADQLPKAAGAVTLPSASGVRRATTAPAAPRRAVSAPAAAVDPVVEEIVVAAPPRRRLVLWITAGIVAGGMAVAIVQAVSPSTPTRVEAGHPPLDAGTPDAGAPRD